MRNCYLLLSIPSNKGTTKKNIIGRKRMTIRGITSPGSITISLELERGRMWKKQATSASLTKITQDTKNVAILDLSGSRNKLTQNMYRIWNIRSSDTKVNNTSYNVTITSRILKRLTITGCKVNIDLHGSLSSPVISKRSLIEKILDILLLRKKNPLGVEEISILRKYLSRLRSNIRN
jgi:hypothetical protein